MYPTLSDSRYCIASFTGPLNLVSLTKSSFASLLIIFHSIRIALSLNAGLLFLVILLWCCAHHYGVHRSDSIGPLWCLGSPLGWHQKALSHGKGCEVHESTHSSLFFLLVYLMVVRIIV